jgi:Putative auto-transporter adhesin, head GIN domain
VARRPGRRAVRREALACAAAPEQHDKLVPRFAYAMTDSRRRHFLLALVASASSGALAAERRVPGSGHIATERRTVSGFERISIAGSFEVEIRQGTQEGVELTGDDNLLALVETRVEGPAGSATLKIGPKHDTQLEATRPVRVGIDLIRLSAIGLGGSGSIAAQNLHVARLGVAIGGAGSVALPGLEAERLALDIGGSGRIRADGRAAALKVSIGGSGTCALPHLLVDDARLDIAGSGNADVNVSQQLSISIAGSGSVRHAGAAVPKVRIAGSGSVQRG